MNQEPLLKMEHIRKVFPGVVALDDVSLTVQAGTIHAIMGENGAGKSTLMKVLIGVYPLTSGSIKWMGKDLDTSSITNVIKSGITMIFQELNSITTMTVCENIYVGREPYKINKLILDRKKIVADAGKLLKECDINDIDPNEVVGNLSIAKRQMIEIAKAISYDARLIIMDEPTSAISERECQHLFQLINRLKEKGIAFIFISHKIDEVYKIADEITVMRDGKYIGTYEASKLDYENLVKLMVGREITDMFHKIQTKIGDIKIEVNGMNVKGKIDDINFYVRKGEILGFSGLIGAGRTEVMETIFGIRKIDTGTIKIDGVEVTINNPREAVFHKIAFITEDRRGNGCFLPLPVSQNIMISSYDKVICQLAQKGIAIILVSSELPEILGMCDRIMVMYEGKISGEISKLDANQEIIMRHASGIVV